MIGWTAQTGEGGWPYQYSKERIQGFLATHRPSAWMNDYGPFSLMPITGDLKVLPRDRASRFKHQNEEARAYRYSVVLDDYQIRVEMGHLGITCGRPNVNGKDPLIRQPSVQF